MKTQHTPGPYEIESRDSLVISANGGLLSICEVHDHSDTSEQHTTEEAEANARFIVTACNSHHELLEACKALTHYLEADADDEQEREDYAQAMAAIAKAQGKE